MSCIKSEFFIYAQQIGHKPCYCLNDCLFLRAMNDFITYSMSDDAILRIIGEQFKQMRLNARMSQADLARVSGLSRNTISAMETGRNVSLANTIILLRYLKKLDVLDAFRTAAPISPRAIVKNQGKMPKRIRSAREVKTTESEW